MLADARVPADAQPVDSAQESTDRGGSLEVFPDPAAAQARAEYVGGIAQASPMFTEYTWAVGPVVVRVSKALTPEQAEQYRQVIAQQVGA